MGTLKYAILGLLYQNNMTGYELTKAFESVLLESWRAKHSQIYPELKQLTQAGLVQYEIAISGTVLEKKVYSITETGKSELLEWISTPHTLSPMPKEEFRLQLFFSSFVSTQQRIALLQSQLEQRQKRLADLRLSGKKFDPIPPETDAAFCDYLVWLGGVMREENACTWLEECIRLCRKHESQK